MVLILVNFQKPPKEAKFTSPQKNLFMVRSSIVGQNKLEILIKEYSTFYQMLSHI